MTPSASRRLRAIKASRIKAPVGRAYPPNDRRPTAPQARRPIEEMPVSMHLLIAGDRDFGLRVEERQAAGLARQPDLVAGGDRRLGGDAGHRHTPIAIA